LMHEFELGIWRALFIHLLRMLESLDPNLLTKLDHQWGSISFHPVFVRWINNTITIKFQGDLIIWGGHNPKVFVESIWIEEVSCWRLWESSSGISTSAF
jgi:hypothetical protein